MRVFELICPLQVAADLEIQQVELFAKALSLVEEKQFQEAVPLLNEYQQYRPGDLYTLVPSTLFVCISSSLKLFVSVSHL